MYRTGEKRNKSISVRTTKAASDRLDDLAARIHKIAWRFHWTDAMRGCDAKSGIIHHIISGNLSLSEIREKLIEKEKQAQKEALARGEK